MGREKNSPVKREWMEVRRISEAGWGARKKLVTSREQALKNERTRTV